MQLYSQTFLPMLCILFYSQCDPWKTGSDKHVGKVVIGFPDMILHLDEKHMAISHVKVLT